MTLGRFDEREGWRILKSMADRASDTCSLSVIIEAMNRLLDESQHECDDGCGLLPELGLEVEAFQCK